MRARLLSPLVAAPVAAVGLVLLVVEAARTIAGAALGTPGRTLMWVGFGLLVIGTALLVAAPDSARSTVDEPEPAAEREPEPAAAVDTAAPVSRRRRAAPTEPARPVKKAAPRRRPPVKAADPEE